jgi:hypothetical protein
MLIESNHDLRATRILMGRLNGKVQRMVDLEADELELLAANPGMLRQRRAEAGRRETAGQRESEPPKRYLRGDIFPGIVSPHSSAVRRPVAAWSRLLVRSPRGRSRSASTTRSAAAAERTWLFTIVEKRSRSPDRVVM